jgi:transposase InsO family protein
VTNHWPSNGLPGPARIKRLRGVVTAEDLVRRFHRLHPDELWVTDITQHRTREGWGYCAAVLDAFSRRIVVWSIDSRQDSTLVVNPLDMAIRNRHPEPGRRSGALPVAVEPLWLRDGRLDHSAATRRQTIRDSTATTREQKNSCRLTTWRARANHPWRRCGVAVPADRLRH